ncbi:MAG: trehalose-phosphatase [Methylocystis sp.]|nr:trehalose-phosphatase [Methylocystis sp.]MBI3274868.1 trehalose-phosphatase [Methylocystis sp.]
MSPIIEDIRHYAIFLDLDGTIVELSDRPDAVHVDASTLQLLKALRDKTNRALAVISGRDIDVIDRLLHPLVLPVAGVHGLRRRDATGALHPMAPERDDLASTAFLAEATIGKEPGIVVERKAGAVAVHFRLRPDLERRCRDIVEELLRRRPDLRLLPGKMVFEIALHGNDKGSAIAAFLKEPPFAGRTPIFAGDDITDEVGFSVVNACHGVSIKIGANSTAARHRIETVYEFLDWLGELAGAPRTERAS